MIDICIAIYTVFRKERKKGESRLSPFDSDNAGTT
jgi:hypothetical protein